MDNVPLMGILVPTRKVRRRVVELNQRYNNLPLEIFAFVQADILWGEHKIIGLCLLGGKWIEKMYPFPQVVYNLCYNKVAIADQFNSVLGGDKFFNAVNWLSKWRTYSFLIQSNVQEHVPDTFLLKNVSVSELMKKYKLIYIKPCYGNHGKHVHRLELKENGDVHISLHSLAPRFICRTNEDFQETLARLLRKNSYIVQKGILSNQIDNKSFDVRALVQKNDRGRWSVSTITCRLAHELYFNTSAYKSIYDAEDFFTRIYPLKNRKTTLKYINQLSVNAARALDTNMGLLGELSVDFLLDNDMKLWIIEINGKPQKVIYKDINDFKYEQLIYRRPLEYAYYLATH